MADTSDVTRRDVVKMAGAATAVAAAKKLQGAPAIQKVHAANNVVNFAIIGTGSRGSYHITHLNGLDGGRCTVVCDIDDFAAEGAADLSKDKPEWCTDYREVLTRQDVDAVIIAVPLYEHFRITRDALLAGKHVFCEKSLVFKPEEVHALRELANSKRNLILQTGLQRRYSRFYQTAKQMIDDGTIGEVTHISAQWHRPNLGANWKPPSWRVYRKYSGGLAAELASHQVDVASWMFGAEPEFVVGVGGIDAYKDGRDTYDNIQLIFSYPGGRKMTYTSISTNGHLPLFHGERSQFGEMIMGTEGTIHITVGSDEEPVLGLWFYEPQPEEPTEAAEAQEEKTIAGATLTSTGLGTRGWPIMFEENQVQDNDSFLSRELKFAKLWLYKKGVMVPEERNPVDTQMLSFFESIRTGKRPLADLEVGLADSTGVILSNLAMDEGRRVYFKEMETMGRGEAAGQSEA